MPFFPMSLCSFVPAVNNISGNKKEDPYLFAVCRNQTEHFYKTHSPLFFASFTQAATL